MSVQNWWELRLRARDPLEFVHVQGFDYRPKQGVRDTWPNAVGRQSLYEDYCAWCEKQDVLQVETDLIFFLKVKPWIYIVDKKWHVKNYNVPKRQQYEGRWITLRVRRYFVRLRPYEEHVEVFEEKTGQSLSLPQKPRNRLIYT